MSKYITRTYNFLFCSKKDKFENFINFIFNNQWCIGDCDEVDKFFEHPHVDCVDCGQCVRVCPWTYAYTARMANQLKISRRDSWSNHAPWLDHDHKINCSNALNFMTSTDAIAAKNAFVLITNLFVIKTLMRRLRPCCHEGQALGCFA